MFEFLNFAAVPAIYTTVLANAVIAFLIAFFAFLGIFIVWTFFNGKKCEGILKYVDDNKERWSNGNRYGAMSVLLGGLHSVNSPIMAAIATLFAIVIAVLQYIIKAFLFIVLGFLLFA